MKSVIILFLLNLFWGNLCLGQSFQGEIIDADTGAPISFVNVMFQKSNRGTTSNEEGLFTLLLANEEEIDTLIISHIAYKPKKIAVAALSDELEIIKLNYLESNSPSIGDKNENALKYIKKALSSVDKNYPQSNHLLSGFYCEEMKHENGTIYDYTECILETLKEPYKNNPSENTLYASVNDGGTRIVDGFYEVFYRYLVMESEHFYTMPGMMDGGNIPEIIDLFKSEASFLLKNNLKSYEWTHTGMINIGAHAAKVISFQPKNEHARYYGEIILDDEKDAILAAKFSISGVVLAEMNKEDYWVDLLSRDFQVEYKKTRNGYTLSQVKVKSQFKHKFSGETFTYSLNYVVTNVAFDTKDEITLVDRMKGMKKLPPYKGSASDYWQKTLAIQRSEKVHQALNKSMSNRANNMDVPLVYAKLDSNTLKVDYGYIIPEKVVNYNAVLAELESGPIHDWREIRGVLLSLILNAEEPADLNRLGLLLLTFRNSAIYYEWLDLRALILYKQGDEQKAFIEQQSILKEANKHGIYYRSILQQFRGKI